MRRSLRSRARRWRRSLIVPTQRVAMLMAELEKTEHGDEGRAREWMTRAVHARRDPAWTADGFVSDRWMPVSPVTGRLDAFQWKDPLAELDSGGAVIEGEAKTRAVVDTPVETPAPPPPVAPQVIAVPAPATPQEIPTEAAPDLAPSETPSARRPRKRPSPSAAPVEKIIPLLHVPDDPGPEPEAPTEPAAEPPPDTTSDGWKRLRDLFK